MKRILWIFAVISASAFADSRRDFAIAWIKKTLQNRPITAVGGTDTNGNFCYLALEDRNDGTYAVIAAFRTAMPDLSYKTHEIQVATTDQAEVGADKDSLRFDDLKGNQLYVTPAWGAPLYVFTLSKFGPEGCSINR
jgi:hypothetical protein